MIVHSTTRQRGGVMSKEFVAVFPLAKGLVNSKQAPFDIPEFVKAQNILVGQTALYPFNPTILFTGPCQVHQDGEVLWRITETEVIVQNLYTEEILYTKPSLGGVWFFLAWGDGLVVVSTRGQYVVYSRNPNKFDDFSYTFPVAYYWTVYNGQLFYITDKIVKCSKIGQIDFTIDNTNEAGAVMLPGVGRAVECIGTRLFAFCSDGLYAVNVGSQVLGLEFYKPFIIQHPYAISSDTRRIVFVDHLGKVHSIWYNGESQTLGYDNVMTSKVQIVYSPALECYLITLENSDVYLLSDYGLTSTTHKIYGAFFNEQAQKVYCLGEEGLRRFELVSQIWLFSQTSLKLLREWELHADITKSDSMSVSFILHYVNGRSYHMPQYALKHTTTVVPNCTASRVQYVLTGNADSFTKMELVKLRWQRADYSHIRGADASGIAG